MNAMALKICGLTDPLVAKQAVQLGVDYIGLVFHEPSKRHLDLEQGMRIADAVHETNGLVVPVFVNQTTDDILRISDKIKADVIQLHGTPALMAYADITAYYPCIIATPYCSTFDEFDQGRDFLLYDAPTPGSGQSVDWRALAIDLHFRGFIAGGINRHNIIAARDYFHPFGFDISTGVESSPGVKDLKLIEEIIGMICK